MKSEPSVGFVKLVRQNDYICIACAAFWNVLTPKEVFEFVKTNRNQMIGETSKQLAEKARDLYKFEHLAVPDITIIIQYLNSSIIKYK